MALSVGAASLTSDRAARADPQVDTSKVSVMSRIQRPTAAVDVGRAPHPGLPPDLALPVVQECAQATLSKYLSVVSGVAAYASVGLGFDISPAGAVSNVAVVVKGVSVGGQKKDDLPALFVQCLKKDLVKIEVRRDPQSKATSMMGTYHVGQEKDGAWLVRGRVREKTP